MAPRTRVLVVDDDPVILELLRLSFEIEGFHVISACDGQEGLERATADHPDVVLSDIMMPRLDGLQLLTRLRSDPATAHLPVVLLSAKAQTSEVEKGIAQGADDYVTKPFDPLELLDRVNLALERGSKRAAERADAADAAGGDPQRPDGDAKRRQ